MAALQCLDHVNVQTEADRFPAMLTFYTDVLGLVAGPRPPFRVDGAWLYCPSSPPFAAPAVVHLVVRPERSIRPPDFVSRFERSEDHERPPNPAPRLDHFCFTAAPPSIATLAAHLKQRQVAYKVRVVPGIGIRQVNVRDPDGNLVELQFAASTPLPLEMAWVPLGPQGGRAPSKL